MKDDGLATVVSSPWDRVVWFQTKDTLLIALSDK